MKVGAECMCVLHLQRNKAQICSFFVRGECKRGAECPYRHEMPTSGPLSEQNIKDRYFGVNDPVANKVCNSRHHTKPPCRTLQLAFHLQGGSMRSQMLALRTCC